MVKPFPKHCEHIQKAKATGSREWPEDGHVTAKHETRERPPEGKLGMGQTNLESQGLRSVEKERHSTGECIRQRCTKASKEACEIIQEMAHLEDRSIPQLLSLEIRLHYFEIGFSIQLLEL